MASSIGGGSLGKNGGLKLATSSRCVYRAEVTS